MLPFFSLKSALMELFVSTFLHQEVDSMEVELGDNGTLNWLGFYKVDGCLSFQGQSLLHSLALKGLNGNVTPASKATMR